MKRLIFFLLLLPAFGLAQNPQLWNIKNSFYDTVRFYSPVYHLSYGVGSTSDSVMVVTSTGKVLRVAQNSIVGATPTIQQVLDAGSTLSSSETITLSGNILSVNGTTTTAQFNASTGALTLSNSGNAGISVSTTYTGTGNFFSRSASSDSPPVASFKNTTDGTNTAGRILSLGRATTGTPGDGLGGELNFSLETTGTGGAEDVLAGKLIVKFSTVDHPTRTSQWDFAGIDNTTEETFMNIQKDLIRFNNNADTVASKAYARSVGGGGGGISDGDKGEITVASSGTVWTLDNDVIHQFLAVNIVGNDTYTGALSISGTINGPLISTATSQVDGAAGDNLVLFDLDGTLAEAGSSTHPLLAGIRLGVPTVSGGAATATNSATLYIEDAMSATVSGANYAVWVDGGNVRIDALGGTANRYVQVDANGVLQPGFNPTVQTLTDGATITWNVSNGANAQVTIAATGRTLSITNPVAGHTYRIRVIQDATGGRTITTWPTNTKWPFDGTLPTQSNGANQYDIYEFYYDGTNYYANQVPNFN